MRAVAIAGTVLALAAAGTSHAANQKRSSAAAAWASGSFAQCVRMRESTDGRGSSNLYGMLPSTWASVGGRGYSGDAPRAEQDYRAFLLYQRAGVGPWRPYDGC